jgi:hypothetical protein
VVKTPTGYKAQLTGSPALIFGKTPATEKPTRVLGVDPSNKYLSAARRYTTPPDLTVRQPSTRVQRHDLRPAPARTFPQHSDIASNMPSTSNKWVHTRPLTHLQILGQPTTVGIDRSRRQTRISAHPQPLGRAAVPSENRPPTMING